jgi:hypothetical protein
MGAIQAGEATTRPARTREDEADEEEDEYALAGGDDADDLI